MALFHLNAASSKTNITGRTANYQPPIWQFDYIQSLTSKYAGEIYAKRVHELKEEVKMLHAKVRDPSSKLEHIDILQRIGLSYHFEAQIKTILEGIYNKSCCDDMWKKNNLYATALEFARDRLMENFLWAVGVIFEPQFGYFRRISTQLASLITVIDNIYDVYGTLEELELFTEAVERWDIAAVDQLPDCMKICFLALHNSINNMAFEVLKDQRFHIIKYLKKAWSDLCKSYLLEAKWYYRGYIPSLEEYIENAWISIPGPVILVHAFFFVTKQITKEALECLEKYPSIIRSSSMIFRFADDLGTSSDEIERGDVPKSIQCYMHQSGASEEEARQHIKFLIGKTWKQMNEDRVTNSPFCKVFIELATNLGRMAQCMYQHGDGYGVPDRETKNRVLSLLINPISHYQQF